MVGMEKSRRGKGKEERKGYVKRGKRKRGIEEIKGNRWRETKE